MYKCTYNLKILLAQSITTYIACIGLITAAKINTSEQRGQKQAGSAKVQRTCMGKEKFSVRLHMSSTVRINSHETLDYVNRCTEVQYALISPIQT
jgi:hypothetical protein